jgi:hypothetical protein
MLWVCGSLILGWVAMGGGSGALAATIAVAASSLGFERVGNIVCSRFRPVIWSLSMVFAKSNEGVHLSAASRLQVTPSVGHMSEDIRQACSLMYSVADDDA